MSNPGHHVQALLIVDLVHALPFLVPLHLVGLRAFTLGCRAYFSTSPPKPCNTLHPTPIRMSNGQWPEWQG